jgi:Rrf2 family transcriptional regulator, iron-sulfur cluster assembly transcription factor
LGARRAGLLPAQPQPGGPVRRVRIAGILPARAAVISAAAQESGEGRMPSRRAGETPAIRDGPREAAMRLSLAAELAVRGAVILAERHGQGPVTLDAMCAHRKMPKQYLTKILGLLARAGLVTSIRGKHGGYVLARPPGKITILDVVEAVEGPIVLNFCQHKPPRCDRKGCPIRPVWADLQKIIRAKLGGLTLRQCLAEEPKKP